MLKTALWGAVSKDFCIFAKNTFSTFSGPSGDFGRKYWMMCIYIYIYTHEIHNVLDFFPSHRFKSGLGSWIRSVRIDWYPYRSITKLFWEGWKKSWNFGSDLILLGPLVPQLRSLDHPQQLLKILRFLLFRFFFLACLPTYLPAYPETGVNLPRGGRFATAKGS